MIHVWSVAATQLKVGAPSIRRGSERYPNHMGDFICLSPKLSICKYTWLTVFMIPYSLSPTAIGYCFPSPEFSVLLLPNLSLKDLNDFTFVQY